MDKPQRPGRAGRAPRARSLDDGPRRGDGKARPAPTPIESASPPITKTVARPARPPREAAPAEPPGTQFLWGRHAVLAALGNPERRIHRFLATEEAAAELPAGAGLPAPSIVERPTIDRALPEGAAHQGLALLVAKLEPVAIETLIDRARETERMLLVALDQVSDPHNVGAVLRSAAAFGAAGVIVPDRHAPELTGTLAKSASGAAEHVPLVRVVNLARGLAQLKAAGFWTVGLAGEAERTLASFGLTGRIVLVLGSEGDGLRRLTREACDLLARLPTSGPVASLNVSNAAAIALYELSRA